MELTGAQRRTLRSLLDVGEGRAFRLDIDMALRGRIEAAVRSVADGLARRPDLPLRLSKERLNDLGRCQGLFQADLAGERPPFAHTEASAAGTLAHKSIELDVMASDDLTAAQVVDRAGERLRADRQFAPYWDGLDATSRSEVQMRAVRSLEQFRASFPPIRAMRRELAPVTELWLEAWFGQGAVRAVGKVDLLLNVARAGRATRVIVDVKSGRASPDHHEDMRLYALLFTLRTGVPPYRVATFLLSSGEWQPEDVAEETLARAADRLIAAVRTTAAMDAGAPPELTPGPHCERCPRRPACPAALAALGPPSGGANGGLDGIEERVATAR